MATFTNAFDSFQVFYYGGNASTFSAVVQVYLGSVFAGRMVFFPTGSPVPANTTISPLGTAVPSIHYPVSSFEDIWGILRHTRPLYLFLDTSTTVGMLATSGFEPIGGP
jgi:hypothetical protein